MEITIKAWLRQTGSGMILHTNTLWLEHRLGPPLVKYFMKGAPQEQ